MSTRTQDPIIHLLEYFVIRISPTNRVTAVNESARHLISNLKSRECVLEELIGLGSYSEILNWMKITRMKEVEVSLKGGQITVLRWEFMRLNKSVICTAINWSPVREIFEKVENANLNFKEILLNILPEHIAEELVSHKEVHPKVYRHSSVMFTDVVSFSRLAFHLDPVSLIRKLNSYFSIYDRTMEEYGIEKIKTIGDSYMSVSGIPIKKDSHAVDCCLAAMNILHVMEDLKKPKRPVENLDLHNWSIRVGIHSGPCISGVIGYKKYTFDIWGDSVNIASRMEKASEPGKINISESTYNEVKDFFECRYRGTQEVKNIGNVDMYFLERLKEEFSEDANGFFPNEDFNRAYVQRYCFGKNGPPPRKALPHFILNYLRLKRLID